MTQTFLFLLATGAAIVSQQPPQPGQTRPFGPLGGGPASCLADVRAGESVPPAMLAKARNAPQSVRIVREGDRMTMDFLPDRITIVVDAEGRIKSWRCG